jgi:hypothetical protein
VYTHACTHAHSHAGMGPRGEKTQKHRHKSRICIYVRAHTQAGEIVKLGAAFHKSLNPTVTMCLSREIGQGLQDTRHSLCTAILVLNYLSALQFSRSIPVSVCPPSRQLTLSLSLSRSLCLCVSYLSGVLSRLFTSPAWKGPGSPGSVDIASMHIHTAHELHIFHTLHALLAGRDLHVCGYVWMLQYSCRSPCFVLHVLTCVYVCMCVRA